MNFGTAQVAGMAIVAFSGLTEVSRAQATGISQTSASAMITPSTARLVQGGPPVLTGDSAGPAGRPGPGGSGTVPRDADRHGQTPLSCLRIRNSQMNETIRMTTNRASDAADA